MSSYKQDITNNYGTVAMGENVHVGSSPSEDLSKLADELQKLCNAMHEQSAGSPERLIATGKIAEAQKAAQNNDSNEALKHLKGAGQWALDAAKELSLRIVTEFIKKAYIP